MNIFGSIATELRNIFVHYKYSLTKASKRPITFHTEAVFNERIWEKVVKFVQAGNKAIWFVLTPVNYDFAKTEHGLRLSKEDYEKVLIEKYNWLKDNGQEIQLHLHLSRVLTDMYDSKEQNIEEQEEYFQEAVDWLKRNGFEATKITFGWWNYDENSLELAKKYGLQVVKQYDYYWLHDFDFIRTKNRPSVLNV